MPSRPDKPALSQSYISDSDGDEKTESKMTKRRTSEKNKSLKVDEEPQSGDSDTSEASEASKADETSDEEESEEEEEEEEGDEDDGDDGDDSTSTSSDQSSDDNQSQSSNQSKRARQEEDGPREGHQSKRQKNSTKASTETSSGKSFVPPKGFKPLVLESSDLETESSEMFSALDAKQVWHICAPASVNVASIKELDLEAALRGEAILSEKGVSYSMQEMQADSSLVLMRGSSGIYRPSSAKVARSFRLAVKAGGSDGGGGSKASSAPTQNRSGPTFVAQSPGQKKPPRKQPEVLGMRYLPFGAETKVRSAAAGTSSAPPQTQSPARKKRSQPAKDIAIQDPMLSPSVSPIPRSSTKAAETGSASSKKSKAARAT